MIEPRELRKGNLVYFDSEMAIGKIVTVATIENEGVRLFNGATHDGRPTLTAVIPFSDIQPIVLTEEILIKAGFEKYGNYSFGVKVGVFENELEYRIDDKELAIWGSDGCTEGHNFRAKTEFLHQLQNLYFDLTRIELEINL